MAYTKYSLTPANNTAAPPDGAPEGMLPSAVNDTMRDMMAQIRDCGDGVRDGTYTMTTPKITGGTITGVTLTGNTFSSPVISGGTINSATVGATTASTGAFTTLTSNAATTFTANTASTSTTTGTTVITGGLGVSGRINAANFDGIVGANTAAAGSFTTINASTSITNAGLTSGRVTFAGASGLLSDSANLTFSGSILAVTGTQTITNSSGSTLTLDRTSNPGSLQLNFGGTQTGQVQALSGGGLIFYQGSSPTEAMRITSAGNVGIGTSSPVAPINVMGLTSSTSTPILYLQQGGSAPTYGYTFKIDNVTTGNLFLNRYDNNVDVGNLLTVTSTGNVGIGTTSPSKLLDVNGDALINGLTVGRGPGASVENTTVGSAAFSSNSSGTQNVAVGRLAMQQSTSSSFSVAVGNAALQTLSTGSYNTVVGASALASTTTGSSNTAVGYQAANRLVTGTNNSVFGYNAAYWMTGSFNTAVGDSSLGTNNAAGTGSNNAAFGYQALNSNQASNNTAVGYQAGYNITTGTDNTFIGLLAGAVGTLTTTGAANTYIGSNVRGSAATNNREIVIGFDVAGQGTETATLGSNNGKIHNSFTVNATWTQTSDVRMKTNIQDDSLGLSFINRLRPVKFTWKPSNELEQDNPYYAEENKRDTTTVIHGLIAQEVKVALDAEGVDTFAGWDMGADGIQAISREMFISPLIKAIQEQQVLIESLTTRLTALESK